MNKSKILFGILISLLSASSSSSIEVVDHSTSVSETVQPVILPAVISHVVFEDLESGVTVFAVPEPESIKIIN